ncbi:uncharacterized protein LOC108938328 isoform X4 [Scleropages formosus]|uniref:uncharacterized protein LOC108938328 isoform X4 n=1 Tax=Scleropages formosus TaxID=113540 RepID=UPI0010FA8FDE|nr:uncharacterized protein LOC108938328 isoform X4 [Scleropages formosus]
MGGSVLLLLGLVCVNVLADSSDIEVEKNVWAVLGEDVVLRCQYIGQSAILYSSWSMEQTNGKWKQLVVYFMQQVTINDNRFGIPISSSNLTVTMNVSSKEDEQEYKCSFFTGSETTEGKVTLRIMAPPSVHTQVQEAVENGLHYQTVICSATGGRPKAELFWLVHGQQASGQAFSINTTSLEGPNGTFTQTSVLQFATHVMNEGYVTCAVNHRALATPTHVRVEVKHFVAPILTMETNLVQEKMEDFHEVTCRAEGGRPAPSLTWSLPENTFREWNISDKMQQDRRAYNDTETLSSTLRFPVHLHEGWNVTCIINHPKFLYEQRRTSSLPTYRFFSMQVFSPGGSSAGQILLEEGNSNVSIQLEVAGNVPHYQVTCTKEDGSLPKDMTVTGSSLWIGGPVELAHAGQYECQASYYQHKVSVQLEIQVIPEELPQVGPDVSLHSTTAWEDGIQYTLVECRAESAKPAPAIEWTIKNDHGSNNTIQLSEVTTTNWTSENGSITVHSVARLPSHSFYRRIVTCVVTHEALEKEIMKEICIPAVEPPVPVVSIRNQQVSSWWLAVCEITWHMEFNLSWVLPEKNTGRTQPCLRTDGVRYWANSTYEFPLDLHEGQNLTCRIQTEHISIDKTVHIPRYNISLALANATLVLRRNLVQRVTLQAHVRNQKVQLRVHGKMPRFNFTCFRSDGSPAITEGVALVFPFLVSEQDAGLYTCHASFYHHHTTLLLQVEVADKDEELWNIVLICFSMAVAIVLILIVCLCIFCKKHRRESSASVVSSNKRESLAALTSLMADHRSPELKKSAVPTPLIQKDQQYPELVRYSIVIDIKSTV